MSGKASTADLEFDSVKDAKWAIENFNGTNLRGSTLRLEAKHSNPACVLVRGLPKDIRDGELEELFSGEAPQKQQLSARTLNASGFQGDQADQIPNGPWGLVIFDDPKVAKWAVKQMNGTTFNGCKITCFLEASSEEGTKVAVTGIPPETAPKGLKEHFESVGTVAKAMLRQCSSIGEVRFTQAIFAQKARKTLDKSWFGKQQIGVEVDTWMVDGTKVRVTGIKHGTSWHDLKEFFSEIGKVASAGIRVVGVPRRKEKKVAEPDEADEPEKKAKKHKAAESWDEEAWPGSKKSKKSEWDAWAAW